jgi:HEAT repeat protein
LERTVCCVPRSFWSSGVLGRHTLGELRPSITDDLIRVRQLHKRGDVDGLVRELSNPYEEDPDGSAVRGFAARALWKLGARESVPHLLPLLDDPNRYVRSSVVVALGKIGDKSTATALLGALRKERSPIVKSWLALSLGQLGHREAVPELIELLDSDVAHLRKNVASALADIGDRRAIDPLRQALRREPLLRKRSLRRALKRLERRAL